MTKKIIQIAIEPYSEESHRFLWLLYDDGSLYRKKLTSEYEQEWRQWTNLPGDENEEDKG